MRTPHWPVCAEGRARRGPWPTWTLNHGMCLCQIVLIQTRRTMEVVIIHLDATAIETFTFPRELPGWQSEGS